MKCFFQDLFKQPKKAPVDSFVQKYELLEADWLVEKIQLTSISLIRDASSHYRQLDLKNQWRANSMPVAEYYIFPISGDSQIQYARTRFDTIGCTIPSESCFPHLEAAFRISVVKSSTAEKGTPAE